MKTTTQLACCKFCGKQIPEKEINDHMGRPRIFCCKTHKMYWHSAIWLDKRMKAVIKSGTK